MNPFCTDLHQTNYPKRFLKTLTIETSLSEFHNLGVTVLKVKNNFFFP